LSINALPNQRNTETFHLCRFGEIQRKGIGLKTMIIWWSIDSGDVIARYIPPSQSYHSHFITHMGSADYYSLD